MKKKIEAELISIAQRILNLKGKEDVLKMHAEVAELYEKLSVLKFAHDHYGDDLPTIGNDASLLGMVDSTFSDSISDNIEVEDKIYVNMDEVEDDDIMEPVMNKIKDMVAHMPDNIDEVDEVLEESKKKTSPQPQNPQYSLDDITAGFKETPVFEPVSNHKNGTANVGHKKSLNEKLKVGGLNIGLNDKIAFIKHLFDGRSEDYDRVVSQLNTFQTYSNAKNFIETIVKPDYGNWEGKEEFEERFMQIVEAKFS